MITRILKSTALILCSMVVCGCAGVQLKNNLSDSSWGYPKKSDSKTNISICLVDITVGESLRNPYLIGEAKTGLLNQKSEIVSDIPIKDIFHNALDSFFRNTGFDVVNNDNEADLKVSGEIQQFWVGEYATGMAPEYSKASVRYDVVFKDRSDKLIWAKSIDAEEKSGLGAIFDTTSSNIPTLRKALFKSLDMIANDPDFKSKVIGYNTAR